MKSARPNWLTLALSSAALIAMTASCTVDPNADRRAGRAAAKDMTVADSGTNNNPLDSGSNQMFPDAGATPNNCDHNPMMCVAHELRGTLPNCNCLGVCEQGWQWQNGQCIQNGMMGPSDAGTMAPSVDGGVPSTDPFNPATLAATYATTVCSRQTRCEPAIQSYFETTEMECVADTTARITANYTAFGNIIAANRLGFSQTSFDNCMQAIQTADCAVGADPAACDGIFTGSQVAGQACALQAECTTGNFCGIQRLGDCGSCQPMAAAGQDCSGSVCTDGTRCLALNDGRQLCIPDTANDGQPCGAIATGLCRGRLQCVGDMNLVCARPVNRGDMCPTANMTGGLPSAGCNIYANDVCVSNVCVAVNWGAAGTSCGDNTSPNNCNGSAHCDANTMQCLAYPGMGETCFEERCKKDYYCDVSSCAPQKAAGASCMANAECAGDLLCVSGACAPISYSFCP
jgi:hypothetical protein